MSAATPRPPSWRHLADQVLAIDHCAPCQSGHPCSQHDLQAVDDLAVCLVKGLDLGADRLAHTLAVGRRCADLSAGRNQSWITRATLAGTLHDIGYAYPVTGMHAVDGAAWLDSQGFPAWLVGVVAHHSTARWECQARGISNPWPEPEQDLADLLWVADFTTSPTGQPTTLQARVAEISSRYPASSPVIAALDAAAQAQAEAAERLAGWSSAWAREHALDLEHQSGSAGVAVDRSAVGHN